MAIADHITCYYCARGDAMREAGLQEGRRFVIAQVTVHDPRGCANVCWDHALWRSKTSGGMGHGAVLDGLAVSPVPCTFKKPS